MLQTRIFVAGKRFFSTLPEIPQFQTLLVHRSEISDHVFEVKLNRPDKSNAMNKAMWAEIGQAFAFLSGLPSCRAIVLSGEGRNFTSGLDLNDHIELVSPPESGESSDVSRRALELHKNIVAYQTSLSSLENARQPVICAIHGACIGGGVDMVCAADIRVAASDSTFSVMEVELGLAADVGTLQRLPKIVGNHSWVREVCLTARKFSAQEALNQGLLSYVELGKDKAHQRALEVAKQIASLSPVAVMGTKANLNWSRDRSVQDGLAYNAIWNASGLLTIDIPISATRMMSRQKEPAQFPDIFKH